MAFEIQEISIQMHVSDGSPKAGKSPSGCGDCPPIDHDAVVRDCVRIVLQALKESQER